MVLANLWLQINVTFDHPQNLVFVHLLEIVSVHRSDWRKQGKADHLSHGSVHHCVTYNFSHVTCLRHAKFSTSALFKFFLWLVFWGAQNNPLKNVSPFGGRRGGGGEKNNTCKYLACALFTITKKCIFYMCLTNAVQKR